MNSWISFRQKSNTRKTLEMDQSLSEIISIFMYRVLMAVFTMYNMYKAAVIILFAIIPIAIVIMMVMIIVTAIITFITITSAWVIPLVFVEFPAIAIFVIVIAFVVFTFHFTCAGFNAF
jgi:hypothetical protein